HGSRYVTSGRITALEIAPSCTNQQCTIWLAAAGGGVWRTDKGLSGNANWVNISDGSFASGAIGALTYDTANDTLYAGTGEDAAAGDADRKSTRLNSSHDQISYAVFCLKKKKLDLNYCLMRQLFNIAYP